MADFGVKFFERSFSYRRETTSAPQGFQGFRVSRCSISRCVPETTLDFSYNDVIPLFFWLGPLFLPSPLGHTIQIQVNISRSVERRSKLVRSNNVAQRLLHCICYFCFTPFSILEETMTQSWSATRPKKTTSRSQTADGPLVDHEGPLTRERRYRDLNDQNDLHTISIHTIGSLLNELGNIPITHPSVI